MSHGLYDRCACGHLHPEHSLFGTCRGCVDCEDPTRYDGGLNQEPDHAYRPCECRRFLQAAEPLIEEIA